MYKKIMVRVHGEFGMPEKDGEQIQHERKQHGVSYRFTCLFHYELFSIIFIQNFR